MVLNMPFEYWNEPSVVRSAIHKAKTRDWRYANLTILYQADQVQAIGEALRVWIDRAGGELSLDTSMSAMISPVCSPSGI